MAVVSGQKLVAEQQCSTELIALCQHRIVALVLSIVGMNEQGLGAETIAFNHVAINPGEVSQLPSRSHETVQLCTVSEPRARNDPATIPPWDHDTQPIAQPQQMVSK
jgi:hypothetical protein